MAAILDRLFTCQHERPTLAAQLADCRIELGISERRRHTLKEQAAHYIDQAIRTRVERDRAERDRDGAQACLVQAMAEKENDRLYIDVLEAQVLVVRMSRDNLTDIADGLRDELRDLRAAVTIGAARRKGRR